MKKVLSLLLLLLLVLQTFATNLPRQPTYAADILLPIGNTGKHISLLQLSQLTITEFETLSGRHLKFADRLGFKLAQRDLRKSIHADGTINNKKLTHYFRKTGNSTGFHFGGFALGFLLGLLGVLIAYLIKDDLKRNRVKWAWIGLGIFLVLSIVLFAA